MSILTEIKQVINDLPREHRQAALTAAAMSDGTVVSLEEELASMTWEHPDLPVSSIINQVLDRVGAAHA